MTKNVSESVASLPVSRHLTNSPPKKCEPRFPLLPSLFQVFSVFLPDRTLLLSEHLDTGHLLQRSVSFVGQYELGRRMGQFQKT